MFYIIMTIALVFFSWSKIHSMDSDWMETTKIGVGIFLGILLIFFSVNFALDETESVIGFLFIGVLYLILSVIAWLVSFPLFAFLVILIIGLVRILIGLGFDDYSYRGRYYNIKTDDEKLKSMPSNNNSFSYNSTDNKTPKSNVEIKFILHRIGHRKFLTVGNINTIVHFNECAETYFDSILSPNISYNIDPTNHHSYLEKYCIDNETFLTALKKSSYETECYYCHSQISVEAGLPNTEKSVICPVCDKKIKFITIQCSKELENELGYNSPSGDRLGISIMGLTFSPETRNLWKQTKKFGVKKSTPFSWIPNPSMYYANSPLYNLDVNKLYINP